MNGIICVLLSLKNNFADITVWERVTCEHDTGKAKKHYRTIGGLLEGSIKLSLAWCRQYGST